MSRFLQFWCKLNTCRIVKTCPFHSLRDYCGNSLDVMFPQFPNHFLPFLMVFLHVSPSVSTISLVVSTVSTQCFPHFLFQILHDSNKVLASLSIFSVLEFSFFYIFDSFISFYWFWSKKGFYVFNYFTIIKIFFSFDFNSFLCICYWFWCVKYG